MEGGLSPERHAAAEPVRSRWTPKPEQILILESIFNSGMVNPPKDETVRIRKLLERFGAVGDANVFYWFQNRRSRSRRRQRQLQAQAAAAAAASSSSSGSPPTSGLAPGHATASSTAGMFAHGATYGSSASASWPPPPSCEGMMGDLDYGGGDDLFAISRQMGYASGGGSGSASSAAIAHHEQQQQQLYYSPCQPASMTVFINGVATEVPRGPIDLRSMFGQDVMLVHSTAGLLPVNEYGVLTQSLQMGESYFLVTRGY
ncbi:WUSCHEL-related homeobox 11 isoform X2 [Zea mays]|uniref:Homeobox domain-containing protein n=1 Tax=Zea mays TaxID=4577 RepID=A0A804QGI1_MAIZE|nr:WUSCHEL-related homeobox 11 isoform X2 [Zea mays]|eukprot:XP_008653490.1 WUSCHEL-related homeobox 11 isoform X2 [Zea mays]